MRCMDNLAMRANQRVRGQGTDGGAQECAVPVRALGSGHMNQIQIQHGWTRVCEEPAEFGNSSSAVRNGSFETETTRQVGREVKWTSTDRVNSRIARTLKSVW